MFLLLLAATIGFQQGDPTEQIEFLRLSYKANKDAFAFGTFHFEYIRGSSASLSDAESGIFRRSIKEDGFYAFDAKNARYDLIAHPKDYAAFTTRIDERRTSSTALTLRMLTDGEVTLVELLRPNESATAFVHSPRIHQGKLFYGDAYFHFPLWIGDSDAREYDLFSDLNAVKDGRFSLVELDFGARLDGFTVCKLSFTWKDGKRTYWIDSSRGSVPLRILSHYNSANRDVIFIFADLEQVQGAGWLPRRRIHIIGPGAIVDRIVVTEIDTRHKPPPSTFQLDFPEPIGLVDGARKLVYPKRKSWSLLNLPGRSSPGTRPAIPSTYISPADLPGEVEAGPPWAIIVPVGVVVFLVAGSILIITRHKKRNRMV
jgi:hypothetical protein